MGDPIKVAVCEALLAINADDPDPAHPFIPPTAIDWIGDLVGCRVRSGLEGHAVIDGEVVALERTGIEGWELYGGDDTRPLLIPAEGVPE